MGPTSSSFMTAPTLITITNNGTLVASAVALQLSDQNNNTSLEGETWACLYSNGSIFVNEPLTTVKGYGQVAIGNPTLAPGATDSYTVVYYAGSRQNTGLSLIHIYCTQTVQRHCMGQTIQPMLF